MGKLTCVHCGKEFEETEYQKRLLWHRCPFCWKTFSDVLDSIPDRFNGIPQPLFSVVDKEYTEFRKIKDIVDMSVKACGYRGEEAMFKSLDILTQMGLCKSNDCCHNIPLSNNE